MVSLDVYVNETTRHADVILPAPSPLRRSHYDLALYLFAVRNVAHYSPPGAAPGPELPDEWVTLLRLTAWRPASDRRRCGGARRDGGAGGDQAGGRPAATADECWPSSSRGSAPSGCSTCCCAPARTSSAWMTSRRRRTGSTSGRWSRGCPTRCAPPSGKIELAPPELVADVPRLGHRWSAGTMASSCWSAAGSCARITRGCTTCRCWSRASRGARCRSTQPTPSGYDLADGEAGPVRSRTGAVECRSRSPTPSCRAWSAFPTAGATTSPARCSTSPPPTRAPTATCWPTSCWSTRYQATPC